MAVLTGLGMGGFSFYYSTQNRNDFASAYPAYEKLEMASGMLLQERTRRTSFFVLEVTDKPAAPVIRNYRLITDKPVISIVSDYTLTKSLQEWGWKETSGSFSYIPHFVSIKYFRVPSGRVWIAELNYDGKTLIDYEQRKDDFSLRRQDQMDKVRTDFVFILISAVAFIWIGFEAYAQLKWENKNGNK